VELLLHGEGQGDLDEAVLFRHGEKPLSAGLPGVYGRSPTGGRDGILVPIMDIAARRIGRRMSDVTFAMAREKGYEKIFTYVRADNGPALAFYEAIGFRTVGTAERQAKFGGKYVDEVIIEKFLV
jgi:hypothetical protein